MTVLVCEIERVALSEVVDVVDAVGETVDVPEGEVEAVEVVVALAELLAV